MSFSIGAVARCFVGRVAGGALSLRSRMDLSAVCPTDVTAGQSLPADKRPAATAYAILTHLSTPAQFVTYPFSPLPGSGLDKMQL